MSHLDHAPLGKISDNPSQYSPALLFPISRNENRMALGINGSLPFFGVDIWNAYELSWLNLKGKPQIAIASFVVPANSPNIIESKSWKLYLNSLNNHRLDSQESLTQLLSTDLSNAAGAPVSVQLHQPDKVSQAGMKELGGKLLDRLDLEIDPHQPPDASLLQIDSSLGVVEESFVTHLLRSNCPVTGQPDWASVQINYVGPTIQEESLLRYLIAFREHQEFHEHCVEKIYMDIKEKCRPSKLSVYARYTRRGGIDINPFRADYNAEWPENIRHSRQ
ncbi:NADPH-dependent 7-cyano-7-deazaguanine reductase QueF [Polynucleobacter sp. 30F-ANTBAC]|uniref:NADPH-dependent 7-cyano-7-deazaguanine reductase QueF n=1 Tax=Polynucleobacter sp. 30F-ANTBAC TaxID=2689095 RepID=UPI001C0C5E38|nr:NADPH-dependent 7-cyano-7-deazaguanine reductase QueF [Polynucleobacter sp. 30F-ANTBAC]MBU3600205.1 NADPH-dependent 7-cyano-7-deazaguanine reductase QueF [Polynucleobacter sp. 30F-ANTBAC]